MKLLNNFNSGKYESMMHISPTPLQKNPVKIIVYNHPIEDIS